MRKNYTKNPSAENAKLFVKSVDMLFSTRELGCDYAIEYADIIFEENIINKITSLFGENQKYTGFVKSVNSIKNNISDIHLILTNIDRYKDYLVVDYPEIYKMYYGTPPTSLIVPSDNIYLATSYQGNRYFLNYKIEENNAIITGYQGIFGGDIDIPTEINGYPVTEICSEAFMGCDNITGITIPNSVSTIGSNAFLECSILTLKVNSGSSAEKYAINNDIPFSLSTPGDANTDGKVNMFDASAILKHIAGWDVTVDSDAADVTDDGKVNLMDVSLLLQYIAGWDVVLK